MIRTEAEYQASRKRADEQAKLLRQQEEQLVAEGLGSDQVKRALAPVRTFTAQIDEEIQTYESLKRGEFAELKNLHGMGQMLIGVRIALGLSQRQLAERLEVHETQVSRDERNEYFGVTVDRASRILDALGVELTTRVERLPELAKSAGPFWLRRSFVRKCSSRIRIRGPVVDKASSPNGRLRRTHNRSRSSSSSAAMTLTRSTHPAGRATGHWVSCTRFPSTPAPPPRLDQRQSWSTRHRPGP